MPAYNVEQGNYGNKAVVISPLDESIVASLSRSKIEELEFNEAKGWRPSSLCHLSLLPNTVSLEIIATLGGSEMDLSPIHELTKLKQLKVFTHCKSPIDFRKFPSLSDCSLEWRKGAESLFDSIQLKRLFINSFRGKDAAPFGRLAGLERLGILNSSITDLDFLVHLTELRELRLARLRLKSCNGIGFLKKVEYLDIDSCSGFRSVAFLANLKMLRRFCLNNVGEVESILPLQDLNKLEMFCFWENTNILDGNIAFLKGHSSLKTIAFRNRVHYDCKRESFDAYQLPHVF